MLSKLTELFRRDANETNEDARIDAPVAAAALMLEVTWADHSIDDKEIATSTELLQQFVMRSKTRAMCTALCSRRRWPQASCAIVHRVC